MHFTLISYYTNDWLYPQYAAALKDQCERFGIDHRIEQRPSTNKYVDNCQIKPFFVRECLQQLRSPVFWIDADASVLQSPLLLWQDQNQDFDLIANQPLDNQHRIHVGSMMLNYTDSMLSFVDAWCDTVQRRRALDDAAFNGTWDAKQTEIKTRLLPPCYFFIHRKATQPIPADTVILHRLSDSELKQRYKKGLN
jgi:hypothetical protein